MPLASRGSASAPLHTTSWGPHDEARGTKAGGHDGRGLAAARGGNGWMADLGCSRGGQMATGQNRDKMATVRPSPPPLFNFKKMAREILPKFKTNWFFN